MKEKIDWINDLTAHARIGAARELRDGQPVTLESRARVVLALTEYLAKVGRSQDWAAEAMGVSRGQLNGVITGNVAEGDEIIRAIDRWLEARALKNKRPDGFARTRVVEAIEAGAKCAMTSGGIVLAHGPAGIGKTLTAQAICASEPGAIFVSVATAGQTAMALMQAVIKAGRMRGEPETRYEAFTIIVENLVDTGRLLIVDEIHKLAGRRKDDALHCLRDVHDQAATPMLWMGMSGIADYIRSGHAKGFESLDQLYSRITLWLDLGEMADGTDGGPGLASIEDIRRFLAARQLRITPDAERYLQALANELGAGAYRTLDKLLQFAVKFAAAKGTAIDADMLRGIQARRLGIRAAEVLETRMAAQAAKVGA